MILKVLSWLAGIVSFAFVTMCLACGLYYLAEFVEEYTVAAKKYIQRLLLFVMAVHLLLFLEDLPFLYLGFSLGCHVVYALLLADFPFIQLTDPTFILSCVLVIVDHFMWFSFFTNNRVYKFTEIASFFLICIWLIPFLFFISLSAGDNLLPAFDVNGQQTKKNKINNVVKSALTWVFSQKDLIFPSKSSPAKAI